MIEYIGETAKTHNCKLIYSYKTTNTKISTNKPLDTMIDESLTLKKDIIMEPGNFVGSIALFIFGIVAFIYKINNDNNNTLSMFFPFDDCLCHNNNSRHPYDIRHTRCQLRSIFHFLY